MGASPKNIVLVSLGTRGDIQPYCVVGAALAAQGHTVTIASELRMEPLVTTEFHLAFRPILGDFVGGLFDEAFQDKFHQLPALTAFDMMHQWNDRFDRQAILASYTSALQGADIVIGGAICTFESFSVAEAIGATWILFLGNVHLPTTEFPQWLLQEYTGSWLGFVNKWTHSFVWRQMWTKQRVVINEWREKALRLPPIAVPFLDIIQGNATIVLHQACSVLLAGPKRRVPLDFSPGKVQYTGFLFPKTPQPEPEPLKVFLAKSSLPLIYIGFGSMPTLKPVALLQLAVDVCKMAGTRCVLVAGWTSLDETSCRSLAQEHADLVYVENRSISHAWLFPQMSCLLHHAGLGTLAAALRSGVPQLPCPKLADQFHNASVLIVLGVALCSISKGHMTAAFVANAVQRVLRNDGNVQTQAKALRAFVEAESHDALPRLCKAIVDTKATFAKGQDTRSL